MTQTGKLLEMAKKMAEAAEKSPFMPGPPGGNKKK